MRLHRLNGRGDAIELLRDRGDGGRAHGSGVSGLNVGGNAPRRGCQSPALYVGHLGLGDAGNSPGWDRQKKKEYQPAEAENRKPAAWDDEVQILPSAMRFVSEPEPQLV
jgi:hypothetical protein